MVVLKREIMNKLSFIFCALLLLSCGSKKKFSKVDSTENMNSVEQLRAELYQDTRLNFLTSSIVKWKRETRPETCVSKRM